MKLAFLALCTFALSVNGHHHHHSDYAVETFKECLNEKDLKMEDFYALREKNDPKVHCTIACVLEKRKILLKDGSIDKDAVTVEIENVFKESERDRAKEVMNACSEEGKDETDTCTKVNKISDCFDEQFYKHTSSEETKE